MSSPAQKGSTEAIYPFQKIGKPIRFGGITIQLVAMPRSTRRGEVRYGAAKKRTFIPLGERFYPYKLGYMIASMEEYVKTRDLYSFFRWELLYERKVRFLDGFGNLLAVKHNNYWESDHLQPLKDMIQKAESIGLRIPLEVFM